MILLKIALKSLVIVASLVLIICGAFVMNDEPSNVGGYFIFFEGIIWAFINVFEILYVVYTNINVDNKEKEKEEKYE